ncbi:phenylalanyl-tRNA synthetase beta subunit [Crinalium epipsammum PCC 9333]|uniref:Phenylalanine--tRNA ligase beta subunit n=1 Tax=Crinalium epipsammum PCC 9333 TaxID=1173022 RepID=K9W584_9CYAN|nr:phenylalanine--tRNA ligase subunit beta [Crinalium epipsammum]AFZ14600.1 phenylalanyl-tRNA synthetase beta subunit [Crinalium epipsammum PCC 9333]
MRISLNWLRELVDVNIAPEELAQMLTLAGFEVEDIEDRRTWAEGVVVGKVITRQQHPNADKLSLCEVDIGNPSGYLNIVCGAANVRADIYVPVATVGTYLPVIDLKIKPTKLRGVRSEGMICSLAEIGLMKESAGIHIFEGDNLQIGADVRPLLDLDDVILDLSSTANRADALSMVGVAREVSALTGAALKLPQVAEAVIPSEGNLPLKISEPKASPAYIGTAIANVKIAASPDWLQRRIQAAGVRPINNVVDITNYILLEWGQPLHAFDRDRLQSVAGGDNLAIGVRFANSDESFKTLDSQTRNLQSQNLIITANDKAVALAGVMGGEETEVYDGTENLILEAAIFDPVAIRRSARSQGLRTEASTRYERGVNQAELEIACNRAIALITELANGTVVAQEFADFRPDKANWSRSIELRLERVNQVLGAVDLGDDQLGEIQPEDVERILTALGCTLQPTDREQVWMVTVPPYRYRDLEREIDLIEEVARLYGYGKFCDTLPSKTEAGYLSLDQQLVRQLREAFRAAGLTEVMHYSYAVAKSEDDTQVRIANPMFTEYSLLRSELIAGLINSFQYNLEQGNGALNAFEIGRVFWSDEEGLAEADSLAGILGGDPTQGKWIRGGREQAMTWFEAKGVLESVFQRLSVPVEYQPDRRDRRLHPGRTASLWIQGERLGTFGQLHPQLRQEKGLPDAVYAFDLDMDVLLNYLAEEEHLTPPFKVYSTYPAADRDIAFFAPVEVTVAEIERVIKKAGGKLLDGVELFDEYRGENVPDGQRSLALRLIYRVGDRTLTDEDVEPVHQKVRDELVEKFRVNLRS